MQTEVKEWKCKEDLTPYKDSMLFDSGTSICQLTLEYPRGVKIELDLVVTGEVSVTYKGEHYDSPEEFPEELRELIKAHPGDFDVYAPSGEGNDDEEGDCYCSLNNWFETLFKITAPGNESLDGFTDGDCYESDISKMSPEELKADLIAYADQIYSRYGLGTKGPEPVCVIRKAYEKSNREKSAEILAEMLMDTEWSTWDMFESLAGDYLSGSEDFRKGIDDALMVVTGWKLSTIAGKILGD